MAGPEQRFVHLHVHSEYSLLDGCARIGDLMEHAASHGFGALALTDHGAAYGLVPFFRRAKAAGIRPILGVELYVRDGDGQPCHLPVLAENHEGYANLLRLVSAGHLDGFHHKPMVDYGLLQAHRRGLIALTGCLKGEVLRRLLEGNPAGAREALGRYSDIFGPDNLFVEIQRHGLSEEERTDGPLTALAQEAGLRLVATNDVHYLDQSDWRVHDVLLAVQTLSTVSQTNRLRLSAPEYYLKSADVMESLFHDLPDAVQATADIAQRCRVDLNLGCLHIPDFPAPGGLDPQTYLAGLCHDSAIRKFADPLPADVRQRMEHELAIINQMGFAGYFLIVWDIVAFARREGIPVGPGRGSGVGSIVSYLLDISTVNPLEHGLLFERFLNPERVSMPDIDIDLCHIGRPRVLEYIRQKWGRDHVAHLGAYTTLRPRAAVRDVGRALGVNQGLIDQMARAIPSYSDDLERVLRESPRLKAIADEDPQARDIIAVASRIQGLPRHMTQHAAGVVLADGPLTHYAALQKAGGDEIITQADMHAVEDLGLLKIDLLGLRYLTVVDQTVKWVAENHPESGVASVLDIPLDDPAVYAAAGRGETIGTFQLESSGMRRLLRRLRPDCLDDIMCVCALFRPGPLSSGMVESFIRRRHGDEPVSHFHPDLEPVLQDTYGVILYQEQVMQVARILAGYSLGRADTLRKAIAKRDPAALDRERDAFVEGARQRGVSGGVAGKVFGLIREFGGYGFAKAHAAAYAQTAVRTVWLRLYYPVPYFAFMLSLNYGVEERFDQYLSEVRYLGVPLLPPDINRSEILFTPEGKYIRAGLGLVRDVGERAVDTILAERAHQPFTSLGDFCRRLGPSISRKAIDHLIRVGAFDAFGGTRPGHLLALQGHWDVSRRENERRSPGQLGLLEAGAVRETPGYCPPEFTEAERQAMEHELLGFYLTSHPLQKHMQMLERLGIMPAAGVAECEHGQEVFIAGCPGAARGHRTRDGKRMMFATLEDMAGRADLVLFPSVLQQYGQKIGERAPVLVWGRVDRTEDEPTVIVRKIAPIGPEAAPGR